MNPSPEEALFQLAVAKPADKRAAFLDAMCDGDAALRQRLEALLAAHEQQSGFLAVDQSTESVATLLDESTFTEGSGTQIGRYKLLEKLSEGGFGSVWAAEQKEPVRRRVALKIIKLGMDTKQVVARFEAERQALAMMDHPNISKVLDAGATETGRPYFVMELVKGIAITKYCEQEKLDTNARLDLFIKVCQAIQHAHQKGIIHRDIKPSNIMVTLHDGVPVPKVIDFGIAKATQQELTEKTIYTQYSQFIGTPAYMSPEQAEMSGLDIDTRSDIYSLGVLLYELLTGSTPFDSKELLKSGLDEMRKIIREREPVRPSTRLSQTLVADEVTRLTPDNQKDRASSSRKARLLPQIPSDLDWIAMKCLEKDRSRRYDTVNGLAQDLKRHLEDDPIVARPPSASYRMQKAWRRNKVVYSAGVAVATALIIGLTVSLWQTLAARNAQLDAEAAQIEAVAAQQEADAHARKAIENERRSRRLLYVSDMALAGQALTQNRTGRTIELLEKHRPPADQEDFRGWEWRYLWQETRSDEISTAVMHDRPVRSVAFSHDGSRLASFAVGDELIIQEMAGIRPAKHLKTDLFLASTAFSRSGDMLAFAGSDKVRVIHVDTGEEVDSFNAPIRSNYGSDRLLAFVTDDSLLYVALQSGEILVRDISNQRDLSMIQAHKGVMSSLVLSRDGTLMVTGGVDGMVHLYEIDDPARPVHRLTLNATGCERVFDCAVSKDKRYVAVCGLESVQGGGYLRLFDLQNSTSKDLAPINTWVGAVEFSHDGRHLVSAGAEQIIQFWDLDSARLEAFHRGHQDEIWSLSISGKDGTIATAGKDLAVKLWAGLPSKQSSSLSEITNATWQIRMSADGSHFARLSKDGTITIMDTSSFSVITTLKNFAELRTFDPVNRFVVARRENSDLLSLIDYQNDSVIKEFENGSVAFSPDGTRMAHQISSNKVSILSVPDLDEVGRYDVTFPEAGDLARMSFSTSGRYLVAHPWAMEFGVLDLISGTWRIYQTDHKRVIGGAIFSPDERYVVTTSGGGRVKVIELNSGAIESYNPDLMSTAPAAFSPDGRILVVITGARRIWMMDWNTRQEMLVIPGMGRTGSRLYFSQDGNSAIVYEPRNSNVSVLRAPSWEEIAAAESNAKAEGKQP